MAVVPLIKEVVQRPERVVLVESDSESESASHDVGTTQEESGDNSPPSIVVRYCINPARTKLIDKECKVHE